MAPIGSLRSRPASARSIAAPLHLFANFDVQVKALLEEHGHSCASSLHHGLGSARAALSSKVRNKIQRMDNAYKVARHLTSRLCDQLLQDARRDLAHAPLDPLGPSTEPSTQPEPTSSDTEQLNEPQLPEGQHQLNAGAPTYHTLVDGLALRSEQQLTDTPALARNFAGDDPSRLLASAYALIDAQNYTLAKLQGGFECYQTELSDIRLVLTRIDSQHAQFQQEFEVARGRGLAACLRQKQLLDGLDENRERIENLSMQALDRPPTRSGLPSDLAGLSELAAHAAKDATNAYISVLHEEQNYKFHTKLGVALAAHETLVDARLKKIDSDLLKLSEAHSHLDLLDEIRRAEVSLAQAIKRAQRRLPPQIIDHLVEEGSLPGSDRGEEELDDKLNELLFLDSDSEGTPPRLETTTSSRSLTCPSFSSERAQS